MNTSFRHLRLEGWRQFATVDIDIHPKLTIITGANGAGKSTILNIFSQHFGWHTNYLATPTYSDGVLSYLIGLLKKRHELRDDSDHHVTYVGHLEYTNGVRSNLSVPKHTHVQYSLNNESYNSVSGIFIPSHRPVQSYQQVSYIPTSAMRPEQAYSNYHNELIARFSGSHAQFSPTYRMKEALISMATFGPGNRFVQSDPELLAAFTGFTTILQQVLPETLGFKAIEVRTPDVVIITDTGEFLVDAASGGIMTLIDLSWRIFLYSRHHESFAVVIDEPENHLHPSMQRSLLNNLIKAFPQAQFIVATHSPFMVSSVRESNVYVLAYRGTTDGARAGSGVGENTSRVESVRLDTVNKAGSANEILRDVLGVRATVPEWVEQSLSDIISYYRSRPITAETLSSLRSELSSLGYGELYPDALAALTQGQ
jgi:hypothetical protein